jgi:ADP-ribose pyrophosphatase YjhB (NUDIX family)
MLQIYKVFFNDRVVFLSDNTILDTKIDLDNSHKFVNNSELTNKITEFKNDISIKHLYIYHDNLNELFNSFKDCFKLIDAAGGVVLNPKNEILSIKRLGKWDLPKGKVEIGENIKEAAIREVQEECGVNDIEILNELSPTYHTYILNDQHILKTTYWYTMECSDPENIKPQTEEDITEVKWIPQTNIEQIKENTYLSIIDVLNQFKEIF